MWAAAVKTLNKGCDDVVMVFMMMVERACSNKVSPANRAATVRIKQIPVSVV